jgi:hypothetical protein
MAKQKEPLFKSANETVARHLGVDIHGNFPANGKLDAVFSSTRPASFNCTSTSATNSRSSMPSGRIHLERIANSTKDL